MKRELLEGLRYLLGHRYWRPLSVTVASSNFFGNVTWAIFLVYAVRKLEMSAELIGLVFSLGNVGWLLGALTAGRLSSRFGVGRTIVGSAVLFGPPALLVPAAPQEFPIPFLVAALAIGGFGAVVFNITAISFQQAVTPDRMLGRLNASRRFIVWGTIPLGQLCGGALASQIGLRPALWVGAVGGCFPFLAVLLSPLRSVGAVADETPAVAAVSDA